jgi:hypothetical protein
MVNHENRTVESTPKLDPEDLDFYIAMRTPSMSYIDVLV